MHVSYALAHTGFYCQELVLLLCNFMRKCHWPVSQVTAVHLSSLWDQNNVAGVSFYSEQLGTKNK
jgi:hypothetical protein